MNHPVHTQRAFKTKTPLELAREVFGFERFRQGQQAIIESVLAGQQSVLAVMPTGAGKSLCYQLPAIASPGLTLVVSPLIALMKDQVDALRQREIRAAYLNSHLDASERRACMEAVRRSELRMLYVSPERLAMNEFIEGLQGVALSRLVVDEAHCVSAWGHDFRPDYLAIAPFVERLGIPQICAFTATATPEVRKDIVRSLGMVQPKVVVNGFRRPNLRLSVVGVSKLRHKLGHILALAESHSKGAGIVYCATRKKVEAVAAELERAGLPIGRYHAGLSEPERSANQQALMDGRIRVMVATNAFGMGIDKADIRFVAHHDMPGSLEAYYQEAGRAGRDGGEADCVLLFNHVDLRVHEFFIERIGEPNGDEGRALDPAKVAHLQRLERSKLRRVVNYAYAESCRQHLLLSYFGDRDDAVCGSCDRCRAETERRQPAWAGSLGVRSTPPKSEAVTFVSEQLPDESCSVLLQKVLSAFARTRGRMSPLRVIAMLRGVAQDLPADLALSRSVALLAEHEPAELEAVVEELVLRGALRANSEGALLLSVAGVDLMHRRSALALRLPKSLVRGRRAKAASRKGALKATGAAKQPAAKQPVRKQPVRKQPGAKQPGAKQPGARQVGARVSAPEPPVAARSAVEALRGELKRLRSELAQEHGVPAFVIAGDALIDELATQRPRTEEELLQVKGIGPARLARYGQALLRVLCTP